MTLATVIRDCYRDCERHDMYQAVRGITGRKDGLSTFGTYCYWDIATGTILYLGLTNDLPRRFREHNRLVGNSPKGNKRDEIDEWFKNNEFIGFSVLTQSSAAIILEWNGLDTRREIIQNGEGQLIQAHIDARGSSPMWNRVGGSSTGAEGVTKLTPGWLDLLSCRHSDLLVARRTIRELAASEADYQREMTLHGARLNALHNEGSVDGLDDEIVLDWLARMAIEPRYGGDPAALCDLTESGYLHLDAPAY